MGNNSKISNRQLIRSSRFSIPYQSKAIIIMSHRERKVWHMHWLRLELKYQTAHSLCLMRLLLLRLDSYKYRFYRRIDMNTLVVSQAWSIDSTELERGSAPMVSQARCIAALAGVIN